MSPLATGRHDVPRPDAQRAPGLRTIGGPSTEERVLSIVQASTPEQLDAIRELVREYIGWVYDSQGDLGAPTFEGLDEELAALPGEFGPPDGRLLLATHDGRTAGCIALRRNDATTGEVKRLYVRPDFRGLRIGEHLVARLLDEARAIGYRRLVLDSHTSMTRAHALYRAAGFRDVPTPEDFPAHLKPVVVFMEMELAPLSA